MVFQVENVCPLLVRVATSLGFGMSDLPLWRAARPRVSGPCDPCGVVAERHGIGRRDGLGRGHEALRFDLLDLPQVGRDCDRLNALRLAYGSTTVDAKITCSTGTNASASWPCGLASPGSRPSFCDGFGPVTVGFGAG